MATTQGHVLAHLKEEQEKYKEKLLTELADVCDQKAWLEYRLAKVEAFISSLSWAKERLKDEWLQDASESAQGSIFEGAAPKEPLRAPSKPRNTRKKDAPRRSDTEDSDT